MRVAVVLGLSCALLAGRARAAELRWNAPQECAERAAVEQQVERLIGMPLGQVPDVDFTVAIRRADGGQWQLEVTTLAHGGAARTRALETTSCSEAAAAAAVAIAMAVTGDDGEPQVANAPAPAPPPRGAEPPEKAGPSEPHADIAQDAAPAAARPPWSFALGVGVAFDGGAMPEPAVGAQLELSARYGVLRAIALGAVFVSQTEELPAGDRGGEFQFAFGGALACGEPAIARLRLAGCVGLELGSLWARGFGVNNEREGSAFWQAARAEAGAAYELAPGFAVALRAGVALPFSRRPFVLDMTDRVHRPDRLSVRGLLGLELTP